MVSKMVEKSTADTFKEQGNIAFKNGEYERAVELYTKAIDSSVDEDATATYYNNRAGAYTKLERWNQVVADATETLKRQPANLKALYRRATAYLNLDQYKATMDDVSTLMRLDPNNLEGRKLLETMEMRRRSSHTQEGIEFQVERLMKKLKFSKEVEEREIAMNNLVALVTQSGKADVILNTRLLEEFRELTCKERGGKVRALATRFVAKLCSSAKNGMRVVDELGVPWFMSMLDTDDEEAVKASQSCLQLVLNTLFGVIEEEASANEQLCDKNKERLDLFLTALMYAVNSHSISPIGRDAILRLIAFNLRYKEAKWALHIVEIKGLQRLLEVVSEVPEYKNESSLVTTNNTCGLAAACLYRIYEHMYYDKARSDYLANVEEFMKELLLRPDLESKVRAVSTITVLLLGPLDVGNYVIGKEGMFEMVLAMATIDDRVQQKVACDCILAAITKADKAKFVVDSKGVDVLKSLCNSSDESIRVRALVALCKAANARGHDAAEQLMPEGSNAKMTAELRHYLLNASEPESRIVAAEGFAYVTFDAETKESLVDDEETLKALFNVAQMSLERAPATVFSIITVFVNLCNAYDKPDITPEMTELAKFAKRHVPEEHEYDDSDFVSSRVRKLGRLGIVSALVALSNTLSFGAKEQLARIFEAITREVELRGLAVQQGAVKTLLKLSSEGTEKGKLLAAQSLARLGITMDPTVAYPGQRLYEVVRPLISLLHPSCSALMNFEALLALCNLFSVGVNIEATFLRQKALPLIESYMYEEHEKLRVAAMQCLCNLSYSDDVRSVYERDSDRFKFVWLQCADEDTDMVVAAAGTVAGMTSYSAALCDSLFNVQNWHEIFASMLMHESIDVKKRAFAILNNVVTKCVDKRHLLFEGELLQVLQALATLEDMNVQDEASKQAKNLLVNARSLGLIRISDNDDDDEE